MPGKSIGKWSVLIMLAAFVSVVPSFTDPAFQLNMKQWLCRIERNMQCVTKARTNKSGSLVTAPALPYSESEEDPLNEDDEEPPLNDDDQKPCPPRGPGTPSIPAPDEFSSPDPRR